MAKVVLKFKTNSNTGDEIEIDDGSITSLNSLSQSSSDSSSINYGLIANTGSIEVIDYNKNIENMIKDELIPSSNAEVDIYVNGKKIQSHITNDSSYDSNTGKLNVSITNKLSDWETLKYKGYYYQNKTQTLYEILYDVFSELGLNVDDSLSETIIYTYPDNGSYYQNRGTVKEYLNLISIKYPVIEYGHTFREIIDDICAIAQLNCFVDDNNNVKFVSARPIVFEDEETISVDKSIILNEVTQDLFVKNKYDSVEISEMVVNDVTEPNALCHTWDSDESKIKPKLTSNSDVDADYINVSSNTAIYRYSKVILNYYEVNIKFDKKSNYNLTEIKDIHNGVDGDGNPKIQYSVDYLYESGNLTFQYKDGASSVSDYASMFSPIYTTSKNASGALATYGDIEASYRHSDGSLVSGMYGTTTSSLKDLTNLKTVDVVFTDEYSANVKILVGYTREAGVVERNPETGSWWFIGNTSYTIAEKYTPISASVNFYGIKRDISFNSESVSTDNIETSKNKASVSVSTNLLQNKTFINGVKLSDVIKYNIINDYKKGLHSAKLKIVCADMFNQNKTKVKDWTLGNIVENNNLVFFEDKVMRINSRDFIYNGSPEIELQMLEQKVKSIYGLFKNGEMIYSWDELIKNGMISVSGNALTSSLKTIDGYLIISKKINTLGDSAFYECTLLTDVSMPSDIKEISNKAFYGCSSLVGVVLPSELKTIGTYAFYNCEYLKDIILPLTIESIGGYAFYNCGDITSINIKENNVLKSIGQYAFYKSSLLYSLELKNTITSIGAYAFAYTKISEVVINSALSAYNNYLFKGCEKLTKATIGSNLTKIGYGWFQDCRELSNVSIPDSVTEIAGYAFAGCYAIKNISLPKNLKSIGSYAFASTFLTSIELPSTLTSIGARAFYATDITKLVIPSGVTSLNEGVVMNCGKLQYVIIPNTVTTIGERAFQNCSSMKHIFIPSSVTTITTPSPQDEYASRNPFIGCNSSCVIYCEASSKPSGWGTNWNSYAYEVTSGVGATSFSYLTVKWGYTRARYESEVGLR